MKRDLDIAIISDVHLGHYSCHAKELIRYLRSIQPRTLIINGDFIDTRQFKKTYFKSAHMEVINEVMRMTISGTKVYYLVGNHDDSLRKFTGFTTGNVHLANKLVLQIKGKSYWIFHGDVFDLSRKISPLMARLGGKGYEWLIWLNRAMNKARTGLGKPKMSLARKIKNNVQQAVSYIKTFEDIAIDLAGQKGYDYVICGHIHRAKIRTVVRGTKDIVYMNSGDWVENLTALEYKSGRWKIYQYEDYDYHYVNPRLVVKPKNQKLGIAPIERLTEKAIHQMMTPPKFKENRP